MEESFLEPILFWNIRDADVVHVGPGLHPLVLHPAKELDTAHVKVRVGHVELAEVVIERKVL